MNEKLEENSQKSERETPPGMPRWVKVLGVAGLVLIILFVVLHLTGHSPFMYLHNMNGMKM